MTNMDMYFKEVKKIPLLTAQEEKELFKEIKENNCQKSKHEIVTANLRFVAKMAKKASFSNDVYEELIQEGNIGLIEAIETFDPERGFRFLSHAVWTMRAKFSEYFYNTSRTVRIPINQQFKYGKLQKKLTSREDPWMDEELAEETGFSVSDIRMARTANQRGVSLDDVVMRNTDGSGGQVTRLDTIGDMEYSPSGSYDQREREDVIEHMLQSVTNDRDRVVIEMLFGLGEDNYGETTTLREAAEYADVSVERTRQIKQQFMKKWTTGTKYNHLKDLVS